MPPLAPDRQTGARRSFRRDGKRRGRVACTPNTHCSADQGGLPLRFGTAGGFVPKEKGRRLHEAKLAYPSRHFLVVESIGQVDRNGGVQPGDDPIKQLSFNALIPRSLRELSTCLAAAEAVLLVNRSPDAVCRGTRIPCEPLWIFDEVHIHAILALPIQKTKVILIKLPRLEYVSRELISWKVDVAKLGLPTVGVLLGPESD